MIDLSVKFTDRVTKYLSELLEISYEGADYMLNDSYFPKLMAKMPEFVMHYSARHWAEDIADFYLGELPEMSSESHYYINDVQAQQIIDTPRTIIEESDVFNDVILPKKERIEHAEGILKTWLTKERREKLVEIAEANTKRNDEGLTVFSEEDEGGIIDAKRN